ncbi:alpha/beta fold hydrolase [Streptomyces chartreusis]|uniref:alpha/beta fold hydrolase n=1 Tax=Streptomyces chartreusis TaxID=1969 RepID=UPI0033ED29AE
MGDYVELPGVRTWYETGSQLAVVPGTSHALPMEKPAEVNRIVLDFLAHEPITTMMPVRRARPAAPTDGDPA